jgi:hypothetical protein
MLIKGVWLVSLLPAIWFIGIVSSQIVYGRCVILEYISRYKKKLPKNDAAKDYLHQRFRDYCIARPITVDRHTKLTVIHNYYEEASFHYLRECPVRIHCGS